MSKLLINLTTAKDNPDKLDKDKPIPGASFAGGAPVVVLLAQGAASLSY